MKKDAHLSNDRLARFFLELSLLVHAGVTAADGVSLLNDQSGAEEPFLQTAVRSLDSGEPLSESLRRAGGFPEYALGLISVGERTGRMEEALDDFPSYRQSDVRFHAVTVLVLAEIGEPTRPPINPLEIREVRLFRDDELPAELAMGMTDLLAAAGGDRHAATDRDRAAGQFS